MTWLNQSKDIFGGRESKMCTGTETNKKQSDRWERTAGNTVHPVSGNCHVMESGSVC